jgi:hypothetical protein
VIIAIAAVHFFLDAFAALPVNSSPPASATMTIFLPLAVHDGGASGEKIGCGDSLVYIPRPVAATDSPLNAAYRELFALPGIVHYRGREYINEVAAQRHGKKPLRFVGAAVRRGVATVFLAGDLRSNECGDPRLAAQLAGVATRFGTVQAVKFLIDGKPFDWNEWMRNGGKP